MQLTGESFPIVGSYVKAIKKGNPFLHSILATSNHALRTIEAAEKRHLMKYIWPFGVDTDSDVLASTYKLSFSVLRDELGRIRSFAEHSANDLKDLQGQLRAIHRSLTYMNDSLPVEQSDMLAQLWALLGANRGSLQRYEKNLRLLQKLDSYRENADAHVAITLHAINDLDAELKELSIRVGAPDFLPGTAPLKIHAEAIRTSTEKLTQDRLRANKKVVESRQTDRMISRAEA